MVIDVGLNKTVTINNIKMLLIGPNMDLEVQGFQANMNFEMKGNEKCIKEFFAINFMETDESEKMYCLVLLKTGNLNINGCFLSLE